MASLYLPPTRTNSEAKQCLLCGSAQTTRFKFRSNLSPEAEACRRYHQVHDLDALAERIIPIQRVHLLRRLNAFGSSTMAKFRCELLEQIFAHACRLSSFTHQHFQVVLSSVSSHWREVTHSFPLLWDHLSLEFRNGVTGHVINRIGLLRLYLMHSGSVPLHLNITFDKSLVDGRWFNATSFIHPHIDDLLIANLYRMKELHLENASTKWLASMQKLPSIQSFRYRGGFGPYQGAPVISFANSHRLSELYLTDWPLINVVAGNFTQITTITLESMEIAACAGLLAVCTNLVEYRSRAPKHPKYSSWLTYQPWRTPVILERLEVFEWDMSSDDDLGLVQVAMFRYLRLPALRSLQLHTYKHCRHTSVQQFCKRLPTSLSTLNLSIGCGDESGDVCLITNFSPECQVKELRLCSYGDRAFILHTFNWLEDPKHFPKLSYVVIDDKNKGRDNRGCQIELSAQLASSVHRAIAGRAPSLSGFFLKLVWFNVHWPQEVKNALWFLTVSGKFRLTIREEMRSFSGLPCLYEIEN